MIKRLYLDHNASTPVLAEVVEAMGPYLEGLVGNPSSLHFHGREARRALEDARDQVAALLGVDAKGVVFTSGASEANTLALLGSRRPEDGPLRVLTSAVEHPSVREAARRLGEEGGSWTEIPVDKDGLILLPWLDEQDAQEVDLVATIAAQNEVGTIQPVAEIASWASRAHARWHVDAVQIIGKAPFAVPDQPLGSVSISGHKVGAPKGIGALWADRNVLLTSQILGGSQERDRRAGTENLAGAVGLGKACELARLNLDSRSRHLGALEEAFLERLKIALPSFQRFGPTDPGQRIPGTISLRLPGVRGDLLLLGLDLLGLSVSMGSACSSGSVLPSHVLGALGVKKVENLETIRVSFGVNQPLEEAVEAAERVAAFVNDQTDR